MDNLNKIIFVSTLIVATQITRLIPMIFESQVSKFVKDEATKTLINDILFFLLICYCFRDFSFTPEYSLRIAVALYVFAVQFKFEKTILSIFSGTTIYMIGRILI